MRVLLAIDFSPVSDRTVKECAERVWPAGTIVRVLGIVEKIGPPAGVLIVLLHRGVDSRTFEKR